MIAGKVEKIYDDGGIGKSNKPGFLNSFFKPLTGAVQTFMEMGKVVKEYEEEANQKAAEYEQARRKAHAAKQKLEQIEQQLLVGL